MGIGYEGEIKRKKKHNRYDITTGQFMLSHVLTGRTEI